MTNPEIQSNRGGGIAWVMSSWRGTTQVLTLWTARHPGSWLLLCLEGIVLMGGALGPNLRNADAGALSVQVDRVTYEFLVLGLLVLFWCGWCEGGYRLGRQLGNFAKVPWHRRLTLELWTGFLFSLLLSVLTSLNTLLPLVAVFLLFGGIESLKASRPGRSLLVSVLRGFRESFRTVSLAPLRLLTLLAVPGLLLYLISLFQKIFQIRFRDHLLQPGVIEKVALGILILLLGLLGAGLFFMARMDLAMNYLGIQHIQVNVASSHLDKILIRVRQPGRVLVVLFLMVLLLFSLYELITSDLFSRNFFYMTLEASVGVVNGFVQSIIDLSAKFAFIFVVITLIVGLCVLLVYLAKGSENGNLERSLSFLGGRIQRFSEFINQKIQIPGVAIQVTTLLSAVSLIATQTYSKIVESQAQRLEQQRRQDQQLNLQQQRQQSYGSSADDQISRFQQNLQTLVSKDRSDRGWLDLDRRGQVASLTRDLTRQLSYPDGNPDGLRRARVLRYLYDSRFLIQNESVVTGSQATCQDALTEVISETNKNKSPRTLFMLSQYELDRKLTDQIRTNPKCDLARLVPKGIDFSGAQLEKAFLRKINLPFSNLTGADLNNSQLNGADLRFANLKDAKLRGADLRDARLDFANLSNADLTDANLKGATFDGAILFYSTRDNSTRDNDLKGSLSWELTEDPREKQPLLWCPLDFRMDPPEAENHSEASSLFAQAGAKCSNRSYSGYKRRSDLIRNRNWAYGNFKSTIIKNFRLNNIDFTNADLSGAVFKYVQLNDVNFTGAKLDGARFEDCVLNNVNFTGASIPRMVFKGSSVERLTFRGAQYVLPIELGDYVDDLLLLSGRNMDLSPASNQSPPSRLAQKLLLPLLLAPFPLRPSRVLFWLVPYSPELLFASDNRQSIP